MVRARGLSSAGGRMIVRRGRIGISLGVRERLGHRSVDEGRADGKDGHCQQQDCKDELAHDLASVNVRHAD